MSESIQNVPLVVEGEIAGFKVLQNGEGRLILAVDAEHLRDAARMGCMMGQRVAVAAIQEPKA